jgi:hypothetical protein
MHAHAADSSQEWGPGQRVLYLILLAVATSLLVLSIWYRQHNWRRRMRATRLLLDGADALEAQLLDCRARMQRLRDMLIVLPEEMSADANSALTADDKVQAGLRDLLGHRLWIKQHADSASVSELDAACAAIDRTSRVMESQLARLDAITAELSRAQTSASSVTPRNRSAMP